MCKDQYDNYNPITDGVIWREMLRFFFPILFGTLFQQLYNAADALIVGRCVGKEALAAVAGSSGQIVSLVVGFFVGIASGATVLVSQYYGAEEREKVSKSVHTVLTFSILCGALMTLIGILSARFLLELMQTPVDIMELSMTYLKVYYAGMIGNLLFNVGSGILRAVGDSKRPLCFLVVSCVANIILDLVFIVPMHMGIFGAALATILSQALSAVLVLWVMIRSQESYQVRIRKLNMHPQLLAAMIRIGLPAGMQAVMYGISNMIIQLGVNRLGTDTVAAWATYYKIDAVFWLTVNAFGIAAATFVGQNYGAGKWERVYGSVRICLLQTLLAALLISATVYMICPWLFPLFTTDANVKAIGVSMMRYLVPFYATYICVEVISGSLRGIGDTLIPMIISGVGICLLRSIWILGYLPKHNDIYTMMNSYPISWVATSAAYLIYMLCFSKLKVIGRK